ncbi:MAG: spermidine/putrescine transport system permease protein [Paracoccaceae bacterium]|jgi:spermidine/putrescine transport system permease protein
MVKFGAKRSFSLTKQPGFGFIALTCFFLLYAPILILVAFSFNEGVNLAEWEGFSLRWYQSAWHNEQVQEASIRSFVIAISASAIATTAATMAALATTRVKKYRGQTTVFALINQPLMVPEIVTAVALLIFFAVIKVKTGYTGLAYLIIAHSAFCIPFAYMPIRARLQGMNLTLETAAADLYAPPWKTFRHVTFPILAPGILAGAMLAFVISLDDVVITEFVKSSGQDTLPTYMLGQLRRVVTPEINAISSVFLALSVVIVTLFFFLTKWKK